MCFKCISAENYKCEQMITNVTFVYKCNLLYMFVRNFFILFYFINMI